MHETCIVAVDPNELHYFEAANYDLTVLAMLSRGVKQLKYGLFSLYFIGMHGKCTVAVDLNELHYSEAVKYDLTDLISYVVTWREATKIRIMSCLLYWHA